MNPVSVETVPRVIIYPDCTPESVNSSTMVHLLFTTQDEKVEYVKKEWRYCSKEYSNYMSMMNKRGIDEAKYKLYKKRVEFARKMGFAPKRNNRNHWVKGVSKPVNTNPPTNIA